jgi:superfamily II DNA or RNA helicase/HKD family nuclease
MISGTLNTSKPLGSGVSQQSLVLNSRKEGRKVLSTLSLLMSRCESFRFFVAFVNQEGVISLIDQLIAAQKRGVKGQILVSSYLDFTEPAALARLIEFPNLDVRINISDSMHGKGYFFYEQEDAHLIVGSSNWTASALSSHLELNVLVNTEISSDFSKEVTETFDRYFAAATPVTRNFLENYNSRDIQYTPSYVAVGRDLDLVGELESESGDHITPNKMQSEALRQLTKLRAEGQRKALIVSATGTGKTYLSAFDALSVDANRLLFVVHRETIAKSALNDFKTIFGEHRTYGLFGGGSADLDADFVFSTVQTLSREANLKRFSPDAFDYVIVDESHRAGAASYTSFLDYFRPKFLLGMTATPERTDGEDIYRLFDFNLAYEIRLQRALEENMLCPFHYFGISDLCVDGSVIAELTSFNLLTSDARVDHIIENIELYGCHKDVPRGLIFCSRVDECYELAGQFELRGKRSVALSGSDSIAFRDEAITRLELPETDPDKLDYIFSVDIFNEGVDIPSVNQIIMLRPTQSAIIFVQQLGRGLRKVKGDNKYLTVIDFIGNYAQNYLIPVALHGDKTLEKDEIRRLLVGGNDLLPGTSTVCFDEVSRAQIFESVNQSNLQTFRDLKSDYNAMKAQVGRIPTMTDFIERNGRDPYSFAISKKSFYAFSRLIEGGEKVPAIDMRLEKVLEVFSKYVLNGKYIEEPLILERLLTNDRVSKNELISVLPGNASANVMHRRIESAKRNLNLEFRREQVKKDDKVILAKIRDLIGLNVVADEGDQITWSSDLAGLLSLEFKAQLSDLCRVAKARFELDFDSSVYANGLVRYRKYDRGDVFRALLWEENPVAQNVGGYMISPDRSNCPIFVTYNKREDIAATIQYEDEFKSPTRMTWFSKSKRTLGSPEIKYFAELGEDQLLPLFVKKSDDEGKSFYYLGLVRPEDGSFEQRTMPGTNEKPVSVVKLSFVLENAIPDALFRYLTS